MTSPWCAERILGWKNVSSPGAAEHARKITSRSQKILIVARRALLSLRGELSSREEKLATEDEF